VSFVVRADPGTLHKSTRGSITGVFFIELGGRAFPEPGWSDFPVVVLGWWIRAALALSQTHVPASCRFMDGPFEWRGTSSAPDVWAITLLDRRGVVEQVVDGARIGAAAALGALVAAADSLLRACAEQGWSSADVDELRAAREALRH
jgi:hypothetical protein